MIAIDTQISHQLFIIPWPPTWNNTSKHNEHTILHGGLLPHPRNFDSVPSAYKLLPDLRRYVQVPQRFLKQLGVSVTRESFRYDLFRRKTLLRLDLLRVDGWLFYCRVPRKNSQRFHFRRNFTYWSCPKNTGFRWLTKFSLRNWLIRSLTSLIRRMIVDYAGVEARVHVP